ncbi:MAG TPA: nucleotidyltransferase family protein [Bosea sp. (in: a-proteobacteria)]|jgi:mannose-1-phosphate guanylyltransferase|uniref:nucleotidyltransferase family protein n=1 Tax=Bosea sp. (in: a-proteobacteria) TaxID=1871050 RepID=UPI002DDCA27B|nr:nucleotidyltransferase family protein [Bosea sp. (in: a-proteobacteria)]HEV2552941.1 nucleotidyltransferase family protein [Bosea sp. (in: a-proteobacteria)]
MRALLLAAGMGTRLRPITDTIPKCLVPIHGKPLLDYWLESLFSGNAIERAVINTHYLASVVEDHVALSPWRSRIDLVFEPELLGTGGTLVANRERLGEGPVLVAHADNLTDFDVAGFAAFHAARPATAAMSMLAFRTDAPRTCGILELDGQGLVQAFHEKVENPPGNLANAAVYIVEPEMIDFAAKLGKPFVDLSTEVIPHFIGRIAVMETPGYHRDIGNPESLARAHAEFRPGEGA